MENPVRKTRYDDEPLYVTWSNDQERASAFKTMSKAVSQPSSVIQRSQASNIYSNISPGTSIRDAFSRRDYETFRTNEARARTHKDMFRDCQAAYEHIGIVYNVINLMGEFTAQGIDIVHPNRQIQNFYQNWFKKVEGAYISERFSNLLYRLANVPVKRTWAKLKPKDQEALQKGTADENPEGSKEKIVKNRIPYGYTLLNVNMLEVLNEEISTFLGDESYDYGMRIPEKLAKIIKSPGTNLKNRLNRNKIPDEVKAAVIAGSRLIPLSRENLDMYYYKKDDWQVWAHPMLNSIMDDLRMLDKLKLTDLAALDSAISHIRIWNLGSLEKNLFPTDAAVNRLSDMLMNNTGGGAIDLIWGPDLKLQETSTEVYKFLGSTKYEPILSAIYAGLGIPPTLTGSSKGASGGFTNNFVSLRTLMERLNYGRSILRTFWEKEIKIVQQAMGFRFPAQIVFDGPSLSDEASELALLVQLWDRGLISDEAMQEKFGFLPSMETLRVKRDERDRESGKKPLKASPYHNPQIENELKKIALQGGVLTPSEVGLELEEKKDGEKSMLEIQQEHELKVQKSGVPSSAKPKGVSGQGRPIGKKDSVTRKQKKVMPRSKASEFVSNFAKAKEIQKAIADIVNPIYLKMVGKSNLRQLTDEEADSLESLKFALMSSSACELSDVTEEVVLNKLEKPIVVNPLISRIEKSVISNFIENNNKQPNVEQLRQIQASVYALYHTSTQEEGEE